MNINVNFICLFCLYPLVSAIVTNKRESANGNVLFQEVECRTCGAKYQVGTMVLNGPTKVVEPNLTKG